MSPLVRYRPSRPGEEGNAPFVIVGVESDQVVATARNEARARLLVVRYNREAAK